MKTLLASALAACLCASITLSAGAAPAAPDKLPAAAAWNLKHADLVAAMQEIVTESASSQDEILVLRNAVRGFILEGERQGQDYSNMLSADFTHADGRGELLKRMELITSQLPPERRSAYYRSAIQAMVGELHEQGSKLYAPGEYRQSLEELGFSLGGIGVYLDENPDADGLYKIIQVMEGLPSEKLGILPGDRVLSVNGENMRGVELTYLSSKLRGPVGTAVQLTLRRGSGSQTFQVQREWLRPNPQGAAAAIAAPGIGWIRVKYLGLRSDADVLKLWKGLEAQGAKRLILDLRNCPGELAGVETMAGLFLAKGNLIYNLEKRHTQEKVVTRVDSSIHVPVVVLINRYSSDAATTLAGGLRDSERATLIGGPTRTEETKAYRWVADELSDGSTLAVVTQWIRLPRGQDLTHGPLEPDLLAPAADPAGEVTGKSDDKAYQRAIKFLQNER